MAKNADEVRKIAAREGKQLQGVIDEALREASEWIRDGLIQGVAINLIAFGRYWNNHLGGQAFTIFLLT